MSSVDDAFRAVRRADFLPGYMKWEASMDSPLPIGYGQTNSQPTTVRMMLDWLGAQPGEKVLDVGSGSGWTTALLSYLVGPDGQVFAVEKVPELVRFGEENARRAGVKNARFFKSKRKFGLPKHAPYDRILVSASAEKIPKELIGQIKIGGRMVIPVKSSIYVIDKTGDNSLETAEHPGFVFVPLV